MKTADYVKDRVGNMPKGYVFTYDEFTTEADKREAVIKALNRMVQKGQLAKLSKGKFYKPEQTPFGELQPDERQIVKDYLEKDGRMLIGYLTGYRIYNQLGLSTQVGNVIQIGTATWRPSTKRGRFKIVFVKQKNTITKENIPLLQLLDAIKNIPDAPVIQIVQTFCCYY